MAARGAAFGSGSLSAASATSAAVSTSTSALDGIRVIECGDLVSAPYAAKLFADLGADVVKVEPPSGDEARRRGPFPAGHPDPESSGLYLYLNCNKRGVTLDATEPRGRKILRELVAGADVLLHNVPPGRMAQHGLDFAALSATNPGLVMTSITPFGLQGPRALDQASDLTLWSAGGVATLNGGGPGSDELPPLKAFGSQAGFQGGVNAALATMGALFERLSSGLGQHVEVSIQECLAAILELTFEYWPYQSLVASRLGAKPIQPLDFVECADGWIFLCCVEEHQWRAWVDLMGNPEWASLELFENRLARGSNWDALAIFLGEWCADKRVDEVYRAAQARRIPVAPVSSMGDLLNSPHLRARGFFAVIEQPDVGEVRVPGAPYGFGRTPWRLARPAPRLGQHNREVYSELGLPAAEVEALARGGRS